MYPFHPVSVYIRYGIVIFRPWLLARASSVGIILVKLSMVTIVAANLADGWLSSKSSEVVLVAEAGGCVHSGDGEKVSSVLPAYS
jgi:hypothetical protein